VSLGGKIPAVTEVRTEAVSPRQLGAIEATVARDRVPQTIIELLDRVWPELRRQGAATAHNVVVYRDANDGQLEMTVGVEVLGEFVDTGGVSRTTTPGGVAAVATHWGDYAKLGQAYEAIEQWCGETGRSGAGVTWEVYGDWDDNPTKVRTDVYVLLAD